MRDGRGEQGGANRLLSNRYDRRKSLYPPEGRQAAVPDAIDANENCCSSPAYKLPDCQKKHSAYPSPVNPCTPLSMENVLNRQERRVDARHLGYC